MGISRDFDQLGYLPPFALLAPGECKQLMRHVTSREFKPPQGWYKGLAVSDPVIREFARDKRICAVIRSCLGDDFVLWGANLLTRKPGKQHPWHSDVESSSPKGGFASVWIGLKNVSGRTSFSVIAGSHLSGHTLQEIRYRHNARREDTARDDVLRWARACHPSCEHVTFEMDTGSALVFDGRIWHATSNSGFIGKRWALLLQYARRDVEYRVFDSDKLDWPIAWEQGHTPQLVEVDCD